MAFGDRLRRGFWCRQPTGIGDNGLWRIAKLNGILYLPDVGSSHSALRRMGMNGELLQRTRKAGARKKPGWIAVGLVTPIPMVRNYSRRCT